MSDKSLKTLPDSDREIEEINRQLFEIIYFLSEKYPEEAEFALVKLCAATEDIHRMRIKEVNRKKGK
jgi:hypothetical protein